MTLEQLKVFAAVVKFGSIRAASTQIYKSAPSISSAIKALESHLDLNLFSRDGYRLILTEEGHDFHVKALQTLRSAKELYSSSRQKGNKKKNQQITMSIDAFFPQCDVINLIESIREDYPDMQLRMTTEYHGEAFKNIISDSADLAITPLRGKIDENVELKYVSSVRIIPVAAPNSKIAQLLSPVSSIDVLDHTQIVIGEPSKNISELALSKEKGAKTFYVTEMSTKRAMIMSGLGWGELPEHLVEQEIENGSLVKLNFDSQLKNFSEHYLVRKMDLEHGPLANNIWTSLDCTGTEKLPNSNKQNDDLPT
ncbi:LysR family transcriptional regulator [Paraglaciecola arctica]|uniref:LysR family transcriptional regulator n=1 Tax=Paraglaciecola arctica TaxID=1128911 RepID=UPI001C0751D5|nr:LysR family transcriptional regulator [Paraglaciecola arctica]MBU3005303.1 LysR family transcriptional regulator [Paraglaciecola arctica]